MVLSTVLGAGGRGDVTPPPPGSFELIQVTHPPSQPSFRPVLFLFSVSQPETTASQVVF